MAFGQGIMGVSHNRIPNHKSVLYKGTLSGVASTNGFVTNFVGLGAPAANKTVLVMLSIYDSGYAFPNTLNMVGNVSTVPATSPKPFATASSVGSTGAYYSFKPGLNTSCQFSYFGGGSSVQRLYAISVYCLYNFQLYNNNQAAGISDTTLANESTYGNFSIVDETGTLSLGCGAGQPNLKPRRSNVVFFNMFTADFATTAVPTFGTTQGYIPDYQQTLVNSTYGLMVSHGVSSIIPFNTPTSSYSTSVTVNTNAGRQRHIRSVPLY